MVEAQDAEEAQLALPPVGVQEVAECLPEATHHTGHEGGTDGDVADLTDGRSLERHRGRSHDDADVPQRARRPLPLESRADEHERRKREQQTGRAREQPLLEVRLTDRNRGGTRSRRSRRRR